MHAVHHPTLACLLASALVACTADPSTTAAPLAAPPLSATAAPAPAAVPYEWRLTDVGLEAGVQDRLSHQKGVGVADFDGDGALDLFVTNPGEPAVLFMNAGDGTFAAQGEVPSTSYDWGPVAFDYDVDGDVDLFVFCGGRSMPCADAAYRNDGVDPETLDVLFTDVTADVGFQVVRASIGAAMADYDLDGDIDLFVPVHFRMDGPPVAVADRADMLYRNNGDGTFTDVAAEAGVDSSLASSASSWLDYDRDGDPDLYVPAMVGGNILYQNHGDGTFSDVTPPELAWPARGFASASQDFDNDGWLDILVAEYYQPYLTGSISSFGELGDRLLLNDGGEGWTDASFDTGLLTEWGGVVSPRNGTMGFQIGDLDLDGYIEVFFGNGGPHVGGGETNRLLSAVPNADGSISFVDRTSHIDVAAPEDGSDPPYPSYPYRTHGSVFLDYDGDDDVDLFIGNGGHPPGQEEPNQLFRNDAAPVHHWVRVRLEGAGQNPAGIGSVIRVADAAGDAATWKVHRHVVGTSGFHVTEPCVLQVGTGTHAGPYVVTVRWPGGVETVVEPVEPRTTLVVAQP